MKKYLLGVAMLFSLMIVPAFVSAQTAAPTITSISENKSDLSFSINGTNLSYVNMLQYTDTINNQSGELSGSKLKSTSSNQVVFYEDLTIANSPSLYKIKVLDSQNNVSNEVTVDTRTAVSTSASTSTSTSTPTSQSSSTSLPADVDTQNPQGACLDLQNNLRYRMRDIETSDDILSLQDFLQANGYLNTEPTGFFGVLTLQAVKNFQQANGISPTGFVGPITRAKIKALSCQ